MFSNDQTNGEHKDTFKRKDMLACAKLFSIETSEISHLLPELSLGMQKEYIPKVHNNYVEPQDNYDTTDDYLKNQGNNEGFGFAGEAPDIGHANFDDDEDMKAAMLASMQDNEAPTTPPSRVQTGGFNGIGADLGSPILGENKSRKNKKQAMKERREKMQSRFTEKRQQAETIVSDNLECLKAQAY